MIIARVIVVGWTLFILWAFLSGIANVRESGVPEDEFTLIVITSIVVHWFAWALVAMPTRMIAGMFERRKERT